MTKRELTTREMSNSLKSYMVDLIDKELCISTQKKYLHDVHIFIEFCSDGIVSKVTVRAFKKYLLEKFKASTPFSWQEK